MEAVSIAKVEMREDVWKEAFKQLEKTEKKMSKSERDRALKKFQNDLKQHQTLVAAQLSTRINKTSQVSDRIIFRLLLALKSMSLLK